MQIHITRGEESFGPYTLEEVQEYLAQGTLLPEDQAWHEGLDDWVPLAQLVPETGTAQASDAAPKKKGVVAAIVVGLLVLGGGGSWLLFFKDASLNSADAVHGDFAQVKVIFEERCVSCHGAERQKGKFRMDTLAGLLEGGSSGPALVTGDAQASLLYERISLHADDDDHMPLKGDSLTAVEQDLVERWINDGAAWSGDALQERVPGSQNLAQGVSVSAKKAALQQDSREQSAQIDSYINAHLKKEGSPLGKAASDQVFVRRAYLDIAGRIPTLPEYEKFMSATGESRRDELVDQLLDSPASVSHTLNLWMNALRVKSAHRKMQSDSYIVWLRKAIQNNMPYNQFVWEQLSASGHIDNPETAASGYFIRDRMMPEDRVATTMQLFLGTSMVCAQCHDHPSDKWTQMDFYKLLAFFSGTITGNGGTLGMSDALKENRAKYKDGAIVTRDGKKLPRIRTEHHYKVLGDVVLVGGYGKVHLPDSYAYDDAKPNELINAGTPFGEAVQVNYSRKVSTDYPAHSNKVRKRLSKRPLKDVNSRTDFADWATSPDNPMFTKTIVNRLWNRVFGVPLIGDLINISESDMGPSPELTAYLVALMKSAEYDQKLFLKILYQTDAYQRVALDPPALGEMPIGAPVVKRLSSEQIWDSIVTLKLPDPDVDVTKGTLDRRNLMYVEMNKRKGKDQFAFVSENRPLEKKADPKLAKELTPDGRSILNKRASLIPSPASAASFLGVFGQAEREIIDDAVREATITQALYLMNGGAVVNLATPKGKRGSKSSELVERLRAAAKLNDETITWAYQGILSRNPSAKETALIKSHLGKQRGTALQDLVWSLVNANEFKLKQ